MKQSLVLRDLGAAVLLLFASASSVAADRNITLQGLKEQVSVAAVRPDGKMVATGVADWTVRLWDAETGKEAAVLKGHKGAVRTLVFSADGMAVFSSGAMDTAVKVWNVRPGEVMASFD